MHAQLLYIGKVLILQAWHWRDPHNKMSLINVKKYIFKTEILVCDIYIKIVCTVELMQLYFNNTAGEDYVQPLFSVAISFYQLCRY